MGFKDIFGSNREKDELEDMETEAGGDKANKNRDEKAEFNALSCFGWENVNTQRLLVILAKVWFGIMSLGWFLFGAVTFAPVIFIGGKVNVIFKDKKKSLFVGGVIYAVMIIAIVLIAVARRVPSSAAV